jgi:hypothetical protein
MKMAKVESVNLRPLPRADTPAGPPHGAPHARKPPAPARRKGASGWTQAVLCLVLISMLAGLFV